jgi:hypothetical protein
MPTLIPIKKTFWHCTIAASQYAAAAEIWFIALERMRTVLVKCSDARRPHSTRENAMMRILVLGAAALALSGSASAQTAFPSYRNGAPLYDYAGPASSAPVGTAPHGYGPLIYTPQLYAPTPAFPAPPAQPGYYTAQSVVQPFYDYAPGHWGH